MRQTVTIKAPLGGIIYPIEAVPDPVFSRKMVGDGLSIDPTTSTLCAPIDGIVTQLHRAHHAITVTHSSGLEVMLHIGLETVGLKSEGFKAYVTQGQHVSAGERLIDFDMDFVATHAVSLLTEIVLSSSEQISSIEKAEGTAVCCQSTLMRVSLAETSLSGLPREAHHSHVSEILIIPNATGIHARPAAILADKAKAFEAQITLLKGDASANAKSITSILSLDISYGDRVQLSAAGSDAKEAIAKILPLIQEGLGDKESPPPIPLSSAATKAQTRGPSAQNSDPNLLSGLVASPGIAIGVAVQLGEESFDFSEEAQDSQEENKRLESSRERAKEALEALEISLKKHSDASKAAIFAAHRELLDDPELIRKAKQMINRGKSAEYAWQQACESDAMQLERLSNKVLAERANDLRDVSKRILRLLTGKSPHRPHLPNNAILISEAFTPSFVAGIDTGKVKGFCTTTGGTTSHIAIIARSLGLPALAGTQEAARDIPDGTTVVLDGERGELRVSPSESMIQKVREREHTIRTEKSRDLKAAHKPALTIDGRRIEVVANIGGIKDAAESVKLGGEGVGLLRSEFLFLDRAAAPSEEEQYEVYCDTLLALQGRPLLVRTLDVGGDKPLAYLPLPPEENPFLGQRGIRIGLEQPEIFRTQVRAILRAGRHGKIRIMFPMISMIDEIRTAKAMLEEERTKLGVAPIETGIMVEVPSVAVMAEQFAKEVDFFSIGTNDLAQYTLAMDRGHPQLAARIDALNPAVLRLIKQTVDGALTEGKRVGICGGLASDPLAVPVLIGLGIEELSVTVPSIPTIKAEVRRYTASQCRSIAQEALNCIDSREVREMLESKRRERL